MLTLRRWVEQATEKADLQVCEIFETSDPYKVGVIIPKHSMSARQEQVIRDCGLRICGMLPHQYGVFTFFVTDLMEMYNNIYQ